MIDDLQRDELGAVGHHVEVGPDRLVLGQHLGLHHTFPPPPGQLEHGHSVSLGSRGHGVLASIISV